MGADGIAQASAAVPLNRPATVEEIAQVVTFVASPAASYATGGTFHADGGRQAI